MSFLATALIWLPIREAKLSEKRAPDDLFRRVFTIDDLTLRPLVGRDAGELFLLVDANRTTLRQTMTWVDNTTAIADTSFYILSLNGFWNSGLTFGIFRLDHLLGTVGFHHGDLRNDRAEIGYWLAPSFHRQGIASKAVGLAIEKAFAFTSLHRLEAKIRPSNRASISLIQKLGFSYEGLERGGIKFKDGYQDHGVYSLLRPEQTK